MKVEEFHPNSSFRPIRFCRRVRDTSACATTVEVSIHDVRSMLRMRSNTATRKMIAEKFSGLDRPRPPVPHLLLYTMYQQGLFDYMDSG